MFENSFFMEHLQWLLPKMVEKFLRIIKIQLEKDLYRRIYKRERFVKTFCSNSKHKLKYIEVTLNTFCYASSDI